MPDQSVVKRRQPNQHPPSVTRAKQRLFLATLKETGSYGRACKRADIGNSLPCYWAVRSAEFAKDWEDAKIQGEKLMLERYESEMDEVLLPPNGMSLDDFARTQNSRFFRMKRLDPRYRDNAIVNVNSVGPLNMQFAVDQAVPQASPGLENKQADSNTHNKRIN